MGYERKSIGLLFLSSACIKNAMQYFRDWLDLRISLFDFIDALMWVAELSRSDCRLLAGHNLRTAYIAAFIGEVIGLSETSLKVLIKAAMLHDLGFVFMRMGTFTDFESLDVAEIIGHSEIGSYIVEHLRFIGDSAKVSKIIKYHHLEYEEGHEDFADIECFILKAADRIDLIQNKYEFPQLFIREIAEEVSTINLPEEVLEASLWLLHSCPLSFWYDLRFSNEAKVRYLRSVCSWEELVYSIKHLEEIGEAMLSLIDFRSAVTSTHSTRVATIAEYVAQVTDEPEHVIRMQKVAGFLHDIGKLVVPVDVLEKPGRLDRREYAVMQTHVYYTRLFLDKAGIKGRVARSAVLHHERMDGTGYPFGLRDAEMDMCEKVMQVADVMAALCEKRSYKKEMGVEEVKSILKDEGDRGKLYKKAVDVILSNFDSIYEVMEERARQRGREFLVFVDEMVRNTQETKKIAERKEIDFA